MNAGAMRFGTPHISVLAWLALGCGARGGLYSVDDLVFAEPDAEILAAAAPTLACGRLAVTEGGPNTITIDPAVSKGTMPETLFGTNIAAWVTSNDGRDTEYGDLMRISGSRNIRWPGGSWGDVLAWDDIQCGGTDGWKVSTDEAIDFVTAFGGTLQPIVNFSGTWCETQHSPTQTVQKAADWVAEMNVARKLGVSYWEIGNEIFGDWETGHTDGADYGTRFCAFYRAMKAIDPSIHIGADMVPYDDGVRGRGYDFWMRTSLTAMKACGVVPDFYVVHAYPTDSGIGPNSDAAVLAAPDEIESFTAALDRGTKAYVDAEHVGTIPYFMTEYNSVNPAKTQTITYLNAMFVAQYILELATRGWQGANLWDTKNGFDFDNGGDFGFLSDGSDGETPDNAPRATYYVFPLLAQKFGRALVATSGSVPLVRAYAGKDADGRLTLFAVNNSPKDDITITVAIRGKEIAPFCAEAWTVTPAGKTVDGADAPLQERRDIAINGTVNPQPAKMESLAARMVPVASKFDLVLDKSTMRLVRIALP